VQAPPNVAAAVAECVYCYGFKFDNVYNDELMFPTAQGSDPHMDGGEMVDPYTIPINDFTDNEAYAVPNGLTVWWICSFGDYTNDNCSSRLDGIWFGDYMSRRITIRNADIQNVRTAIQMPTSRDTRGNTGSDAGFTTIEDSYLVATEGISIFAPVSVNGSSDLSPQTTVVRNVRFDYPDADQGGKPQSHIMMHDESIILGYEPNLTLRNDVRVENYNRAPGVDGDDLYIVPDYQGPGRCDSNIGQCGQDISNSNVDIKKGHVYPLR